MLALNVSPNGTVTTKKRTGRISEVFYSIFLFDPIFGLECVYIA